MNIEAWQMILAVVGLIAGDGILQVILRRVWEVKDKNSDKDSELKRILADLKNDISNLNDKLDAHIESDDERHAIQCRMRILRFNDELLHDISHTKEHFDQTLIDCSSYEKYCKAHPDFKNDITMMADKHIHDVYMECTMKGTFL